MRPKVVIVGLDGVPHSLLQDLIRRGRLDQIRGLSEKGGLHRMAVSLPEISSVSWSAFMTGANCGTHGIFGFVDLRPGTYTLFFPNFSNLRAPTIWDDLGRQGKRSVVINLPSTYPAREIPGILISGFVAIDLNRAVFPPSLIPALKALEYCIDIDTTRARTDHEFLITDLNRTLTLRERAVDCLWSKEAWDAFMVVVSGTDRLNHYLWKSFDNEDDVLHDAFLAYYEGVDRFVGRMYQRYLDLPKETQGGFVLLSDHGFTGIRSEVYLTPWLVENGFLGFSSDPPTSFESIADGTRAFAMDPSRIYVHQKGRYPRGEVAAHDVPKVAEDIRQGLMELSIGGDPVMRHVFSKEEIYDGPFLDQAPDLVCLSRHGFDLKGSIQKKEIFDRTDLCGMHTQDDAFFCCDRGNECDSIFRVKSILLDLLSPEQ